MHGRILNAYIAGIVDGEGTIGVHSVTQHRTYGEGTYRRFILRAMVSNTDLRLLNKIKDSYGGSIAIQKNVGFKSSNHKVCYAWKVTDRIAERFLRTVEPYLFVKKQQATTGIKFREYSDKMGLSRDKLGRVIHNDKVWREKEKFYLKMKELNSK